ncbi:MAG: hypothetical protein JXR97_02255, partial [Planctomycetes bacterium]|nr:hypothetical protein [Planctomycetota bacterium]
MPSRKELIVVIVVMFMALAGSYSCKNRLDALSKTEKFKELLYVPKGETLKIMTFGFDAPVADYFWVEGKLYYSDNIRAIQMRHSRKARYRYLHLLHDIITDLQPRFGNAYHEGAIYLFSTGREDLTEQGIALLEKGVAAYDKAEADGVPIIPDARWRMYVYMASAYEGRLYDPVKATEYYEKAVKCKDCPANIVFAYAGYKKLLAQGLGLQARYDAMIATWSELL